MHLVRKPHQETETHRLKSSSSSSGPVLSDDARTPLASRRGFCFIYVRTLSYSATYAAVGKPLLGSVWQSRLLPHFVAPGYESLDNFIYLLCSQSCSYASSYRNRMSLLGRSRNCLCVLALSSSRRACQPLFGPAVMLCVVLEMVLLYRHMDCPVTWTHRSPSFSQHLSYEGFWKSRKGDPLLQRWSKASFPLAPCNNLPSPHDVFLSASCAISFTDRPSGLGPGLAAGRATVCHHLPSTT